MRFVTPQSRSIVLAASLAVAAVVCMPAALSQTTAQEYEPQTPVGRMMKGLNPANWKMPTMKTFMPGQEDKDRIIQRKDGLMTDVKETAARSWTKTKQTLNPMRLIPTGLFSGGDQSATETSQGVEKAGFFGSLLGTPKSEVQQTSGTVDDFLRQNKPVR